MHTKSAIFFNLTYTIKTVSTNFLCSCVLHSLPQDPEQTSPSPGAHVAELRCLAAWAQGHYFTDKSCCEENWMWGTASLFHWEVFLRRGFTASPSLCIFTDGQQRSVCSASRVTPSILPLTQTGLPGLPCHCGLARRPLSCVWFWSQLLDESWC